MKRLEPGFYWVRGRDPHDPDCMGKDLGIAELYYKWDEYARWRIDGVDSLDVGFVGPRVHMPPQSSFRDVQSIVRDAHDG